MSLNSARVAPSRVAPVTPAGRLRAALGRLAAAVVVIAALGGAGGEPTVLLPTDMSPPLANAPSAPGAPAAPAAAGSASDGTEESTGAATEAESASAIDPIFAEEAPRPPVLNGDILGEMAEFYTWTPDTLLDIARGEELGLINLMSANPGVDPWLPGKGTHLILPTAHILPDAPRRGVVINIAELRLYLYKSDGEIWSFPIGVGREGFSTPLGQSKVVRKKEGPTWYPTAAKRAEDPEVPAVVPPGPENPMGEFALYLGWPTYAVHGTNQPWAVGRRVTRGCIRLYPEDIAWVFEQVPVGTPVSVVDQPIKLGRRDGDIFVEVHPSLKQIDQIEETGRADPDPLPDQTDMILAYAGDDIGRLDWPAINQALAERRGYPIRITRPAAAAGEPSGADQARNQAPIAGTASVTGPAR